MLNDINIKERTEPPKKGTRVVTKPVFRGNQTKL